MQEAGQMSDGGNVCGIELHLELQSCQCLRALHYRQHCGCRHAAAWRCRGAETQTQALVEQCSKVEDVAPRPLHALQ